MQLQFSHRGAIFDLDGTLLDSLGAWAEIDVRFLTARGIPVDGAYTEAVKHMTFPEAAAYTKERYLLPESVQDIQAEWMQMIREEYRLRIPLKPHAGEFLQALHAHGVTLALATSSRTDLFLPALERCGVRSLFSVFVTTEEAARGKNFPDVYLLAAERLALMPKECAVFEDIVSGVRSAKEAGFFTVAVQDESAAADQPALRALAHAYLPDYSPASLMGTGFLQP